MTLFLFEREIYENLDPLLTKHLFKERENVVCKIKEIRTLVWHMLHQLPCLKLARKNLVYHGF